MAKPWNEVVRDERFQRLDPKTREKVRQQYFEEVVAPRFESVAEQSGQPISENTDMYFSLRERFDDETRYADLDFRQEQYEEGYRKKAEAGFRYAEEELGLPIPDFIKPLGAKALKAADWLKGGARDYQLGAAAEDLSDTILKKQLAESFLESPELKIALRLKKKEITPEEAINLLPGGKEYNATRLAIQNIPYEWADRLVKSTDLATQDLVYNIEDMPLKAKELIERTRASEEIPRSPQSQDVMQAESFGDALSLVGRDPAGFVAETGIRSLPLMAPALAEGAAGGVAFGPLGFAVGMGHGSFTVDRAAELAGGMLEILQQKGVDITNPDAVAAALDDPDVIAAIKADANLHASVVGLFDALSGGAASLTLVPKQVLKKAFATELANMAVQTQVQGALGAIPEILVPIIKGEQIKWGEVMAEYWGEFVTAPVDVITATVSGARNVGKARVRQIIENDPALKELAELLKKEVADFEAGKATREDVERVGADLYRSVDAAFEAAETEAARAKAADMERGFQEIEAGIPETTPEKIDQALEGRALEREVTGAEPTAMEEALRKAKDDYGLSIEEAEAATEANPTEAQIESGNYRKGKVNIQGLDVAIENPRGSVRRGVDENGNSWETPIENPYGYIKRTEGADGEQVDVFLGPGAETADTVYVINQVNPETGEFDEHKVMLGFDSGLEARTAYASNYEADWDGFGGIVPMTMGQFKAWLKTAPKSQPASTQQLTAPAAYGLQRPALSRGKPGSEVKPENVRLSREARARESAARPEKKKAHKPVTIKEKPRADVVNFDGVERVVQTVTWEALPSVSSGFLPGIHSATQAQIREFNEAMLRVITDKNGVDLILQQLGVPFSRIEHALGSFELVITPNMLTSVVAEKEGRSYNREIADLYSNIIGYIFTQDAVPWHRADPKAKGKHAAYGLELVADRDIDGPMARQLYEYASMLYPGLEFTLINGKMRFVNFRDDKGKPFLMSDKKFLDAISTIANTFEGFEITDIYDFKAEAGFHANNWTTNTKGQEFESAIREAGRPDLLDWVRDRRRLAVAEARRIAKRYGWEDARRPLAAPVSLARLSKPEAAQAEIYGRFGELTKKDTTEDLKIYNLDRLVEDPTLVEGLLKKFGYRVEYFAFHEDARAGVEFIIPKLKKQGYKQGVLWIYDPRVAHGSFMDVEYTRQWRIVHELAHAITEDIMQAKYGDSRREGRLGRTWITQRGKPPKQINVEVEPLSLQQAQRAVEWEDVSFRVQRMLMEDLGVAVEPTDFAREYNTNIGDALYRVLTGDFGDPGQYGLVPNANLPTLKSILKMLEATEQAMAKEQGRAPTKGADLSTWKRTTQTELRAAMKAQELAKPMPDRRTPKGRGMGIPAVRQAVSHPLSQWTNGPAVEVIETHKDMPDYLRHYIESEDAVDDTDGLYDPNTGKVYLIVSKIGSVEQAQRALFHEALGHYALRQLLDNKKIQGILQGIYAAKKDDVAKIAERYDFDLRNREDRLAVAEEWLANEAQINPRSTWVQRVISLLRQWLRKVFPSLKVTDAEIVGLLGRMQIAVKAGRARKLQAGKPMAYTANLSRGGENVSRGTLEDGPFAVPQETLWRALVRKLQDKYDRLRVIQELPEVQVNPEADAYLKEELFHGRVEYELERFEDLHVKPLLEAVSESDITMDELDDFLYALHAPERNEHINEINPRFREEGLMGSGMSDQEAADIIQGAKDAGKYDELMSLARKVHKINKARMGLLRRAGLEPEKNLKMWEENYQYYVPLRGFKFEEGGLFQRIGRGFSIKGRESKRALGRRSRADSPIIYSILQMEETIIRAEKNRVGQSFLRLVLENPNPDLWQLVTDKSEIPKRPVYDERTGEVAYRRDPMFRLADDVMTVKFEGKEYYIKIKDPLLARAMVNLGVEKNGAIVQTLGSFNRYLAMVNTSLNPEFVISNAARDIQTALINIQARTEIDPTELSRRTVKDLKNALKGIYRGLRNPETDTEWVGWFRRFSKTGGKIGFFGLETIQTKRARLESNIRAMEKDAFGTALRVTKGIRDYIMDVNASVENAARLSVFKNAVEMGLSDEQAASIAKNLTVNFNRKGELATLTNAMYLFYNASIQGTATMWRAAKSKRVQAMLAGIATFSFMLTEMNRLIAGEDKDGENCYDKIPDWIKRRNLIVMNPIGGDCMDYFKFPLPYGYNFPYVVGMSASDVIHGDSEQTWRSAINVAVTLADSFNPVGNADSDNLDILLAKMVSPTITDPIVDMAVNENFMGSPIMPEQPSFGPQIPDSQRFWNSVSPPTRYIAEKLNELTGGSQYESGLIDVSPESIEHITQFFTGGAGAFLQRMFVDYPTLVYGKVKYGEEIPLHKIPFARKFVGERTEYDAPKNYYEQRNEVIQIAGAYRKMKKEAQDEDDFLMVREFERTNMEMIWLHGRLKTYDDRLKKLRDNIAYFKKKEGMDEAERRKMINKLKKQQETIMMEFSRTYNAMKKKRSERLKK